MINISDNFKALATAGGREPFCVIKAGDKVFLDDEIKSFQLQDVIYPEELTFGTACSCRFHFELNTTENIPLSAVIMPYIGFGEYSEEAELCPLGVYYISKRYRRFNNYSVTCYDRMYRLEDEYSTSLGFPVSSQELLQEICDNYGLEFTGECESFTCENAPYQATVRDVLGYLAGLDGSCARFDRYGRLCFRKIASSGFGITREHFTSLSLKQDPITVQKIVVTNDDESFKKGEGSLLGTYQIYNPLAGERTAAEIYNQYGGFSYYGLELDMQGLPFLEAGDIVTVQNDTDDGLFNAVIGELDFTYDGSFWAQLYSRSKNPVQDSAEAAGQEELIEQVSESLQMVYYNYRSERAVTVSSTLTSLAEINLQALKETSAVFAAQLEAQAQEDCTLTLSCTVEDKDTPPEIRVTLKAGEIFPICLHNFFSSVSAGYITVRIYGATDGGAVTFAQGAIVATVSGQYLAVNSVSRSPNRTVYQDIEAIVLAKRFSFSTLFQESCFGAVQTPVAALGTDSFAVEISNERGFGINISDIGFAPIGAQSARIYSLDNIMYAELTFYNPLYSEDVSALTDAFAVRAVFTDEYADYAVSEAEWDRNVILTLTIDGIFAGAAEIKVLYDSAKGDITDGFSGEVIDSFEITAELDS